MKTINYQSIRVSLFFLVLLIFIPLFAIVFHSAREYKLSAKRSATENALRVARHFAEQQKLIESNARLFLEVLSQMPEIKSGDSIVINRLLSALLKQNKSYATIILVDTKGKIMAAGLPYAKVNVGDRKYFKDVFRTKSFAIGEYTRSRLTHKAVIHYAYPVLRKDSSIQSVLTVSFDLSYFNEIFKNANLGDDAVFTFVDCRGVILYQSPGFEDRSGLYERPDIFHILNGEKSESTFLFTEYDKISRLYGYERLSLGDRGPYMYVYVGVPEKKAYSEFRKILSVNVFIWILGAVCVIIAAYFFCLKFIINPIDKLVKTAGQIADGNLETRTGIGNTRTELGFLAFAIDEMTDKLQKREMEQKLVQKDLRKLKERFELAINAAHIGIWDWHIRNNTLLWDKNMYDLYGIDEKSFDGKYESWMKLIHPEDLPSLQTEMQNAAEYHQPFRSEFRIKHPECGEKYIRIFTNVIDDKEGKPVRLIGVNWEITERKMLERKLSEAKEKAETSDKLKSAFLANVSHEIRTPLHGIIGFAQILKENEITSEERVQYLDIIVGSGIKLMNIISNIIDISMLDAGQLKIMEAPCNLTGLMKEIYYHYGKIRTEEDKKFEFTLESEPEENLCLVMDDFRFRQILSNLLDNAFKFTERGEVGIGYRIFNGELLCYVRDTGIGINSENLLKIFDRFKQVEEGINRNYSGSGLGLAICKGLLDLMDGRIWAVSKETGTEFYFSLPLRTLENIQTLSSSENGYISD